jgi:hypothetical protein
MGILADNAVGIAKNAVLKKNAPFALTALHWVLIMNL